ncbi:DUF317 domain-containing protein [Streptomyces sp. NPDC005004]
MSWCTRTEIREVSDAANKIYEDIRHGRLAVHTHADDGWTKVAVGTYLDTGTSVHLHGENHLRQVETEYPSAAQALSAFQYQHGPRARPGPTPATDTERQTEQARTSLGAPAPEPEPEQLVEGPQTVPSYAADPGDGDALLEAFLTENNDWEKWRTWDDAHTHVFREDHTLRIEQVHEAHPRETAWTVAAYETPVSDRLWHLTATTATPAPVLQALLAALGSGKAEDTPVGDADSSRAVAEATRPLTEAGWQHNAAGRWMHWQTPHGAGLQFDSVAAQHPDGATPTWTLWAGPNLSQPTWAIQASSRTPIALLTDLAEELAHGTGQRIPIPPRAPTVRSTTTPTPLAAEPPPPAHSLRAR